MWPPPYSDNSSAWCYTLTMPTLPDPPIVIIPWGGTTTAGVTLANTCPLHNWFMIVQVLLRLGKLDLDRFGQAGLLIKTALSLIDQHLLTSTYVLTPNCLLSHFHQ